MKTNYSSQRNLVEQVLKSCCDHPTAEMVYLRCKQINPKIGIATVYRNLDMLEKNNHIVKVCGTIGKERYDADTSIHSHCVCSRCGKVEDVFETNEIVENLDKLRKSRGYETICLTYYNVCKDCK